MARRDDTLGGEGYYYIVDYEADIQAALDRLRQREFEAGRYNPVTPSPGNLMPIGPESPAPGAGHASIDEAMMDTEGDGSRSILDLYAIADEPEMFTATRLTDEQLVAFFGSTQPGRDVDIGASGVWSWLDRGSGAFAVLYRDGRPDGILFVGMSVD